MEGRLALIKLIQDLPLDSDTPQSNNARRQGLSIIKALICAGNIEPDFRTDDEERLSPIHLAFQKRDPDLLTLLIECGANLATKDNRGDTVLHIATENDDLAMVKTVLSEEIKSSPRRPIENSRQRANKLDSQGRPALWWAAARRSPGRVFCHLLTLGPEVVNFRCEDEDLPTALWAAASRGRLDKARALLRNGADPMVRDRDQSTLLHKVQWHNMAADRSGADVADTSERPGLYADLLRHPDIDAAARDSEGRQPIHFAAAAGELAMCKALLDHLRDRAARQTQQKLDVRDLVNAQDNNGATPLMYAAGTGQIRVVRMLIAEYQADVRAVKCCGSDAFAIACDRGFLTTAIFLLGAYPERDLDMTNDSKETALARAQKNGHSEVVNWLVGLGARTG
ncbi:hypothetical protein VTJ04DRAFT_2718 [Mycothermus thermophilus]|uniref:uncharacterized protein n=1 Tax=Humicola insolens TaxID=85995 RepID=UPI00374288C8